jgi:hypothetical protein
MIRPMDDYDIKPNDDRRMWEFFPKKGKGPSYQVTYEECDNEADAWIALWLALKRQR